MFTTLVFNFCSELMFTTLVQNFCFLFTNFFVTNFAHNFSSAFVHNSCSQLLFTAFVKNFSFVPNSCSKFLSKFKITKKNLSRIFVHMFASLVRKICWKLLFTTIAHKFYPQLVDGNASQGVIFFVSSCGYAFIIKYFLWENLCFNRPHTIETL